MLSASDRSLDAENEKPCTAEEGPPSPEVTSKPPECKYSELFPMFLWLKHNWNTNSSQSWAFYAVDLADISQLQAPTFTTINRGPPEPMLRLDWTLPVNLIGEKVSNPMIHCCDKCLKPILIYGRLVSRSKPAFSQHGNFLKLWTNPYRFLASTSIASPVAGKRKASRVPAAENGSSGWSRPDWPSFLCAPMVVPGTVMTDAVGLTCRSGICRRTWVIGIYGCLGSSRRSAPCPAREAGAEATPAGRPAPHLSISPSWTVAPISSPSPSSRMPPQPGRATATTPDTHPPFRPSPFPATALTTRRATELSNLRPSASTALLRWARDPSIRAFNSLPHRRLHLPRSSTTATRRALSSSGAARPTRPTTDSTEPPQQLSGCPCYYHYYKL